MAHIKLVPPPNSSRVDKVHQTDFGAFPDLPNAVGLVTSSHAVPDKTHQAGNPAEADMGSADCGFGDFSRLWDIHRISLAGLKFSLFRYA